ncbi:MAG: undecaprenyl-diphosphate phosphatase [Clostridia bacterium]|nr:undecaprenyl-diphosphate phosphatase [Clostridia bacterium]
MGIWEAIWKSAVLGTVQGLTEFLPVSSSGHLTLLQQILGYDLGVAGMTFVNILLHFGTLLSVVLVFWKDILALFKKPFKTLLMLIVATIPAGVIGLLFDDKIEALFDPGSNAAWLCWLAVFFAFTAFILLLTEFISSRKKKTAPLSWRHSIPMGLAQAAALFPGISRSGSTIAAGVISGAKREEVAKFSFLMSIPVILGSLAVEVFHVVKPDEGVTVAIGTGGIIGMIVGVVFSAVAGFFAIKVMLKVINKGNYKWFAVYLVALSFTCFWLNALGVL